MFYLNWYSKWKNLRKKILLIYNIYLGDSRKLLFKTVGMTATDIIMRFNCLMGNPELSETKIK